VKQSDKERESDRKEEERQIDRGRERERERERERYQIRIMNNLNRDNKCRKSNNIDTITNMDSRRIRR
jgi:hypothetical protein